MNFNIMSGGHIKIISRKFSEEVTVGGGKTVFNLPFVITANSLVFEGIGLSDQDVSSSFGTKILTFPITIPQGITIQVKE